MVSVFLSGLIPKLDAVNAVETDNVPALYSVLTTCDKLPAGVLSWYKTMNFFNGISGVNVIDVSVEVIGVDNVVETII